MQFSPGKLADRWARTSIMLCVIYSTVCALALAMGWGGQATAEYIGAWGTMPVECAVGLMLWPVITDAELSVRRRLAYRLLFGALLLDMIANVGWGYSALTENVTFGSWPDVLYLFYYPMAAAACGLLYFDLGGRLDTARSLIDFATVAIGFGTLLWFTALEPLAGMNAAQLAHNWSSPGYGIGKAIALIAGAMVAMTINDWRSESPLVWLLAAMVATLATPARNRPPTAPSKPPIMVPMVPPASSNWAVCSMRRKLMSLAAFLSS
jgi:hypothetical protein